MRVRTTSLVICGMLIHGCGDETTAPLPDDGVPVDVTVSGLEALGPTEGSYEAWVVSSEGEISSAGRFAIDGGTPVSVESPFESPQHFMITVEPPGDDDDRPSLHKILGGPFQNDVAVLGTTGYVTVAGIPLESEPGVHVLGSPSNNALEGFPSSEDAGLWLFNPTVDTLDAAHYVDLAPLTEGWWYEGWVVRDYGSSGEVWLSYGKFRSDGFRQANTRDDTGLGLFSGRRDHRFALILELHVPGDDWLADTLGLGVPGNLTLPLDLNGDSGAGIASRWTHVISIEPWGPDREAELPNETQQFFLAPYRNAIGEAEPSEPRTIGFHADELPTGMATLRR